MARKPLDTWLSWKHRRSEWDRPASFAQKVDLFYEKLFGWQLHIADICANGAEDAPAIQHSGFAAPQIALSYFETIGKYQAGYYGHGESRRHFKLGLKSVFPSLRRVPVPQFEARSNLLYEAARCGLYHTSYTGAGVLLRRQFSRATNRALVSKGEARLELHDYPEMYSSPYG
jgi:hypothetical protein